MMDILFLPVVFLSLFILFSVSRHDFVLIRQGISLRQVFDKALISIVVAFIFSRVFYALYFNKIEIFNPLKFLYLTQFPGVFIYAGFMSGLICIYFLYMKRKNILRVLDLTLLAFFPIALLDLLLQPVSEVGLIIKSLSILVLVFFYGWFLKVHSDFSVKDGMITFLSILVYSLVTLSVSFVRFGFLTFPHLIFQLFLILISILCGVGIYLLQTNKLSK